jgi:hypothetical protein
MQRKYFFLGKVFPYLKFGQNKCPFSILATDFRKKKEITSSTREGTKNSLKNEISLHNVVQLKHLILLLKELSFNFI